MSSSLSPRCYLKDLTFNNTCRIKVPVKAPHSWFSPPYFPAKCMSNLVHHISRVCAAAQYAVLEVNGKVNGIGEISHPYPSQTLGSIWMPLQIYHYVPRELMCKIWLKSIQPLPLSACVKKWVFAWVFCLHIRLSVCLSIYLSIYLSVPHHAYRPHF